MERGPHQPVPGTETCLLLPEPLKPQMKSGRHDNADSSSLGLTDLGPFSMRGEGRGAMPRGSQHQQLRKYAHRRTGV